MKDDAALKFFDNKERTLEHWKRAWPDAIADWSPYVQLREPIWCLTEKDEKRQGLTGSFAMIRLVDHAVVISLRQIVEKGLHAFAVEILAHEIGHHVYCPADLTDNARLLARIRRGLPGCEEYGPMVSNLYADLLINDRLQRSCQRNMAGVYQTLKNQNASSSKLWQLYVRIYELLWGLPANTLTDGKVDGRVNQDALLGSRLIRSYSKYWLQGAGRFACLLLPYMAEEAEKGREAFGAWCDAIHAGVGGSPDGMTDIDDDEEDGVLHPAEDPFLNGLGPIETADSPNANDWGRVSGKYSGRKSIKSFRQPFEYAELLKASGSTLNERQLAVKYYRERALPYVVPFPSQKLPTSSDPIPEGLEVWEPSSELDRIDWIESLIASPTVIPGVTTKERLVGDSPGNEPEKMPFDLYLGVDCSGSMGDPAYMLSYPVLAGTVMAISALRAGASVKVVLSGEPGKSISTAGFVRDQEAILQTLVNYLGTGYSFGIHRLQETFQESTPLKRPVHVLILSDYDMFRILDERGSGRLGWDVAQEAARLCLGGATYLLQLPGCGDFQSQFDPLIERMKNDGWNVHLVNSMEELVTFARQFSHAQYTRKR